MGENKQVTQPFSLVVPKEDVTFKEPCVRCNYCGRMVRRGLLSTGDHIGNKCPEVPVLLLAGKNFCDTRVVRRKETWT